MSSDSHNSPDNAGGRSLPADGTSPTPPANTGDMPGSAAGTVTTSSAVTSTGTVAASDPLSPENLEVIDGFGHVRPRRQQPQTQPQLSSGTGTSVTAAEAAIMQAAVNIPVNDSNTNLYRMPGTNITADARRHDPAPFQTVDPAWLNEPWLPSWDTHDTQAGELGVADRLEDEQQGWVMLGSQLSTGGGNGLGPGFGSGAAAGADAPHPSSTDFGGQQGVGLVGAAPRQTEQPITLAPIEGGEGQAQRTPVHVSGFGAGASMQPPAGPLGGGSGPPAPSINLVSRDGADEQNPRVGLIWDFEAGAATNHPQVVTNPPPRVHRSPAADHPRPGGRGRGRGRGRDRGTNINPPSVLTEPVHGAHGPGGTSLLPPGPTFPTGSGPSLGATTGLPPGRPHSRSQIPITRFSTDDEIRDRLQQLPDLINEQQRLQVEALNGYVAALPEFRNQPPEVRSRRVQDLWMNQTQFFERIFIRDQNVDNALLNAAFVRHGRPAHPLSRQRVLLEVVMRAANGQPQDGLSPGEELRSRRVILEAQLLTMRAWTHAWSQRLPLGHPARIDTNIPFNDGIARSQPRVAQTQAVAAANNVSVEEIERITAFSDFMESR
ncbi:hypothetical protein EPUS_08740 [Endocarpon pusillum Z07020]|uniref:Uncharacterized protein n=1 Tax=Endocarpon pusillum (strain Z07020 / HMAS-L-300199) TaxID=1263415 RepID=U1HTK6_ENDPU|nr:uncharacterized protein EPUS_08740 [Endocarpon pusillum Z07020]ERF72604.1 hypothetical protein EPUS_08740 [Endocarpon pusillum Z07020]